MDTTDDPKADMGAATKAENTGCGSANTAPSESRICNQTNSAIMLTKASPRRGNGSHASGRHARDLLRATSYITDEGEVLARELPRQSFLSRIKNGRSRDVGGDDGNKEFVRETLRGLYRRAPDKALYVLKERRNGTMMEIAEGVVLPTRTEDVVRRQEHLINCGVGELRRIGSTGRGVLGMVKEAFVREFGDLYEIVGSMESRKWDVCKGDVYALFEWLKMVENCLRVYVCVSQGVYIDCGMGEWGIVEKRKILKLGESVESMKRVMIGMNGGGKVMKEVMKRVDGFVEGVFEFLEEEYRIVGRALENRFEELVKKICEEECGKEAVVLLGRGARDGDWGRRMGGWRAVRRVRERHWDYVELFVKAEREYRSMYETLAKDVGVASRDDGVG